jgi:uncharacterized membrane protein
MKIKQYKEIINTSQGKVLLFGVFLVLFLVGFLSIYYFIDVDFSNKIAAMVVTNIIVGRVPSLSLGYASGLDHIWVIGTNVYIEMVMAAFFYAAFVFSYNNITQIRYLNTFFTKIGEYRIKYANLFDKYGIFGLFIFVFSPFWMTGPSVGSIMGYLIGLRPVTTIVTVLFATIIAMSIWGLLLNELVTFMNMISSSFIWIVLGIVALLAVILRLVIKKE